MIPAHVVEAINTATDLPALVREYGSHLQPVAGGFITKCPIHHEKTASFRINTKGDRRNTCHCFGCGFSASGPVNFIMMIEGWPFPKAAEYLALRAGISLTHERHSRAAHVALAEDGAACRWWWQKRWEMVRAQLDAAMEANTEPDDEWCDCLGRMLRAIETMPAAERLQEFRLRVTGAERAEFRSDVAWDKGFGEAWMSLALKGDQ